MVQLLVLRSYLGIIIVCPIEYLVVPAQALEQVLDYSILGPIVTP